MSFNVAMLKAMRDEGLDFDAAIRVLEAGEPVKSAAAVRQKRYRDNKRDITRDVTPVSLKEDQNPSGTVLPNEAIASLPIRQPVSEATGIWNETAAAVGWPQVHSLSANRQKLLSARLREHGLDLWRTAVAKARASPYLAGADPPPWFNFPWLIKAENFLKLIEGNYDRRHNDNSDPTFGAVAEFQRLVSNVGSGP